MLSDYEDAVLRLMVRFAPGEHLVKSLAGFKMTDEMKLRLASRLEDRFKAWSGESLIAFKVRRAAEDAIPSAGGEDGSA